MTNKEKAFLQYYASTGQNAQRKVECYRLAFGDDIGDVKDSSVDTYAKRLLATRDAKEWLQQHRPNNELRSEQLLNSIKELQAMKLGAKAEGKTNDVLSIMREIRLHLQDLAKCVEPIQQSEAQEWIIIEDRFCIMPVKGESKEDLFLRCKKWANSSEPTVICFREGKAIEMIPYISETNKNMSQHDWATFKEGFETGEFAIAVRK